MAADPTVDLRRRFTVDEYERMVQVGILTEDDRVELLDGEIVTMSPIGPRHASVVDVLMHLLVAAVAGRAWVRVQNPVRLLPFSEPEPDVVVARNRRDRYAGAHPAAEDALLVIEVAESSLRTDRAIKVPIYAAQGVAEVWVVDLAAAEVHVHADPADGAYRHTSTARVGDVLVPTLLPEVSLAVADLI